jgi:hypothetical protein
MFKMQVYDLLYRRLVLALITKVLLPKDVYTRVSTGLNDVAIDFQNEFYGSKFLLYYDAVSGGAPVNDSLSVPARRPRIEVVESVAIDLYVKPIGVDSYVLVYS